MGQCFHWISPVNCSPGVTGSFQDVDLDSYVGGLGPEVTGVLLRFFNVDGGERYIGWRKKGSTDNRPQFIELECSTFAAVGVDANHIFQVYIQTVWQYCYIYAYTTTPGVEFFTNGVDKSLGAGYAWTDTDCSTEAPGAIGLIFETHSSEERNWGFRKKGSTDNRTDYMHKKSGGSPIIGCNGSQVCQQYITNPATQDAYLSGYVTDLAIFHTNGLDRSLGVTGSYQDLAALPADAAGGFYEVMANLPYKYDLRKKGYGGSIYYDVARHLWAPIECDNNKLVQGQIENVGVDFFEMGYAILSLPGTLGKSAAMAAKMMAGRMI